MSKQAFGTSASPLSPALQVGNTIYVSGQVPVTDGEVIGHDIEAQTAEVLRNIEKQLALAGASLADVVKTTVILTNVKRDFQAMNRVYAEFFPDPKPARTTIGAQLAIDILVEIEAVAVVSGDDSSN
jgi:2-iminobutanoate/2-iminopropanoate deaminase